MDARRGGEGLEDPWNAGYVAMNDKLKTKVEYYFLTDHTNQNLNQSAWWMQGEEERNLWDLQWMATPRVLPPLTHKQTKERTAGTWGARARRQCCTMGRTQHCTLGRILGGLWGKLGDRVHVTEAREPRRLEWSVKEPRRGWGERLRLVSVLPIWSRG